MSIGKRVAVFAAYDRENKVQQYVLTYLKFLREAAQKIVVVYDNDLPESEKCKILPYADEVIARAHGEYDFGSYKRGYQYVCDQGWLAAADEFILCNDSCFCLKSLAPAFAKKAGVDCDFWAATKNHVPKPHLQSFFLVFRKPVFLSAQFRDFLLAVRKQRSIDDIIEQYEIGLSQMLYSCGFKESSVVSGKHPQLQIMELDYSDILLVKKKFFINDHAIIKNRHLTHLLCLLKKYPDRCREIEELFGDVEALLRNQIKRKLLFFLYEKCVKKELGVYKIKIFRVQVWKAKLK